MNIERPIPDQELAKRVMVEVPNDDKIQHWFTYHAPTGETIPKYNKMREAALAFARIINEMCPDGPDKSVAIRKIREAVMTANASIACCGK